MTYWMTLEFYSYTHVYVVCMTDILHVHFKWIYTVSTRLDIIRFKNDLVDKGMIVGFCAILCIV